MVGNRSFDIKPTFLHGQGRSLTMRIAQTISFQSHNFNESFQPREIHDNKMSSTVLICPTSTPGLKCSKNTRARWVKAGLQLYFIWGMIDAAIMIHRLGTRAKGKQNFISCQPHEEEKKKGEAFASAARRNF